MNERRRNRGLAPASHPLSRLGSGWDRQVWLVALAFVLVTGVLYINSIGGKPIGDDISVIVAEQRYKSLQGIVSAFSRGYRPLRTASYALDHLLFGNDYRGYHLLNIALHALVSLTVFALARRLLGSLRAGLIAGLLFAIHPVQTEVVAYLSGRRDLLTTLFFLLGFLAFLRYRETRRGRDLALVVLAYVAGMLAKEMAVTLPLLCLAYEVIQRQAVVPRAGLWSRLWGALREKPALYGTLFGLAASFSFFALRFTRVTKRVGWWGGDVVTNFLTVPRIHLHHLKTVLYPVTLNATYSLGGFPPTTSWGDPWAWAAVFTLAGLLAGLCWLLPRAPLVTFGGLWFFLTLLPVSHIKPFHVILAERHLYLPLVGLCLLAAIGVERLLAMPRLHRPILAAVAIVALLLSVRTILRNRDWRDGLTLWRKNVQTLPSSAQARYKLGMAYLDRGRLAQAEEQLREAVRLRPDFSVAVSALGKVLADQGRMAEAEPVFRTALGQERRHDESFRFGSRQLKHWKAVHLMDLGIAHLHLGRLPEAEQEFRAALALNPRLSEARIQLAILLLQTRRVAEAEQELRRVLHRDEDPLAYNTLGVLYATQGKPAAAEQAFRDALRLRPALRQPRENLIRLYVRQGRMAEAEQVGRSGLSGASQAPVPASAQEREEWGSEHDE